MDAVCSQASSCCPVITYQGVSLEPLPWMEISPLVL